MTLSKGVICNGNVNLILADGAKLTTTGITNHAQNIHTAGIRVSGENNTLTIYGQTEQTGQLIAIGGFNSAGIGGNTEEDGSNITINGGTVTANSESEAAGIGGGYAGNGTNITINGGTVTANGGIYAAGIGGGRNVGMKGNGTNITINDGTVTANGGIYAAGIGGGEDEKGSNIIIINGGEVTANGGDHAAGIGGGEDGHTSNIKVATTLLVKADGNNPPNTEIENNGDDLSEYLAGKRYVTIGKDLNPIKNAAIAEINDAIEAVEYESVLAIANTAKTDINAAKTERAIRSIKEKALEDLAKAKAIAEITSASQGIKNTEINNWIEGAINDIQNGGPDASPGIDEIKEQILNIIYFFQNGKAEGKAEAFGTLGEKQDGPAVEVIKGDKKVILYSPDKVNFIKVNE